MLDSLIAPFLLLDPPSSRRARTARTDNRSEAARASVRVTPLAELAFMDRGWTRGHAHLGFPHVPRTTPGWLDFPPVLLAAMETIDAGAGYPMHEHRDIESLMFVLNGSVIHEDNRGGRARITASELGVLSAGTGLAHSEYAEPSGPARVVVLALAPGAPGGGARFSQRHFPKSGRTDRLVELASGRASRAPGALPLGRDAALLAAALTPGAVVRHQLETSRRAYLLTTDAAVSMNGERAEAGERALVTGPGLLEIHAHGPTELLLLDID